MGFPEPKETPVPTPLTALCISAIQLISLFHIYRPTSFIRRIGYWVSHTKALDEHLVHAEHSVYDVMEKLTKIQWGYKTYM